MTISPGIQPDPRRDSNKLLTEGAFDGNLTFNNDAAMPVVPFGGIELIRVLFKKFPRQDCAPALQNCKSERLNYCLPNVQAPSWLDS